ncbi:MAG: hypothetical protein ETSY2_48955 [Candidatus Entotheonella gemina]|uniref:Tll0287-like domain-containing protein n=1 Tax=Candidatus Entotheonella gemina TaxID=1429439 RepID=W4LAG1_9BACT|nr:MAG: hypothetical protein ETSY2_48955 [Candidatus Entotheonella gemina]
MTKPSWVITVLVLTVTAIYLFAQAPEPLPVEEAASGKQIPIETVLTLVAAENDTVRALWTREIVGAGKKAGLAFDEDWRDQEVEAGPLPALFLREAATSLEKHPIRLSLFLGSDFPINASNLFTGRQEEMFKTIKQTHQPQFFFAEDTRLYTAMFPDLASVKPCVTCHNQHPDTPKADWVLDDVMGATTWSYPKASVTMDEFMEIIAALRKSFRDAYEGYLEKAATFSKPPLVGDQWPRDGGYTLPSAEAFLKEFTRRASARTVDLLLSPLEAEPKTARIRDERRMARK